VRYRKGPNFADVGNFSAAGAAEIIYLGTVAAPQASLTVGENDYYRALLTASPGVGGGVAAYWSIGRVRVILS